MRQQKQWKIYQQHEWEHNKTFLRRLSVNKSVKIFKILEDFASKLIKKTDIQKMNMEKIKILAYVHALFGKVK